MLTISNLGTQLEVSNTLTTIWTLQFQYYNICTNFDHDGTSSNFTGRARLCGNAVRVGTQFSTSLAPQPLGPAPTLTMTVVSASYFSAISIGHWLMTVENVANPFGTSYLYSTFAVTQIQGSVACISVSFQSADQCVGEIHGNFDGNHGQGFGDEGVGVFELTRGGFCPV